MGKTYVTFGQTHAHSVNGKTFDKDCVAVIESESAESGRVYAFDYFGYRFCTTFYDKEWKEDIQMRYYPRGYINVN